MYQLLTKKENIYLISNTMSNDLIFFEETDTLKETAIKTALIFAGSVSLTKELAKLKVTHTKVQRGGSVVYILRNATFGKVEVKL